MANDVDGSIRIKATVNDEKAQKQLDKLEEKLNKQTEAVKKQDNAVKDLQKRYDKLASGEVEPKGMKSMISDLKKTQAEADKLYSEFERLSSVAEIERGVHGKVSPETQAQLDDVSERLAAADAKADKLNASLEELRLNPQASDEAVKLANDLDLAKGTLSRLESEAAKTGERIDAIISGNAKRFGKLGAVVQMISQKVKKSYVNMTTPLIKSVEKVNERIKEVGQNRGFDKAGKSAHRFGNRLKRIVSGALFFNIISRGLTQLRESLGSVLKIDTQFTKSLAEIKGNLLTAFQPIYSAVMPMLNTLMSALSNLSAQAAAFIATIFGTNVKQAQKNAQALYEQANATEAVGNAAEAAEKQLASFDTIQKLSSGSTSKSDKNKPSNVVADFTTSLDKVKVPDWLKNFWKVFQDSWAQNGAKTIEAAKNAIAGIKGVLESIGKAFINVWTSGAGEQALNSIHGLLQNLLNAIGEIATAFSAAWDSGIGESILTHLLGIITNIVNTVSNLTAKFREAWQANGNGQAIMSAILGIVDAILATIDRIVKSTAEWAGNLNLEPLISGIRKVLEPLKVVVESIGEALAELWEEVALPFAKWIVESAVPKILEWLGSFFNFLAEHQEFVKAFVKVIASLWLAFEAYTIVNGAITVFKALLGSLTPVKLVLAAMIPLIAGVISAWKDMSTLERVVSVLGLLVTAAAAAAIAVGALQSAWSLGIAAAAIAAGVVAITAAVNSATKKAQSSGSVSGNLSSYGSSSYSSSSYRAAGIPALADGAVISPNNEFLAVLGDQKHGVNIETPLSTMKQAFLEAMSESGGGGANKVNINFTGSLSQLARVLKPEIEIETVRAGTRLVEGGSY